MPRQVRIGVGIVAGVILTVLVLANLGALSGGAYVLQVAGTRTATACYLVIGAGVFLCTLALVVRQGDSQPASASSGGQRRSPKSSMGLRLVVATLLFCPLWSAVGVGVLRWHVQVFRVTGDEKLLEAKRMEAEKAVLGFRLRATGPPGAREYALFVRRSLAKGITERLKAEGIGVSDPGRE